MFVDLVISTRRSVNFGDNHPFKVDIFTSLVSGKWAQNLFVG